jgi:hypothetical protein
MMKMCRQFGQSFCSTLESEYKTMRTVRSLFGWLFGSVALWGCIFEAMAYRNLLLSNRPFTPLDLVARCVMGLLVVVFAGTWWTSWNEKRWARTWGILASLLGISVTFVGMHLMHHHQLQGFVSLLLNAVGLFAYVWPDREAGFPVGEEQ